MPSVVGGGVLVALVLILAAALGGTGGADGAQGAASGPAVAVSTPVSASLASATIPTATTSPTTTTTPTCAVKVQYAGDAIPDAEFPNSLAGEFDVCSPDTALLTAGTADGVRLYASEAGGWKRIAVAAQATKGGGRCDSNQVNVVIPYAEEPPSEPSQEWSSCRKYRVVIPETSNFRKSSVDFCVRTRGT